MQTQTCYECNVTKPLSEFGIQSSGDKTTTNFHAGIVKTYKGKCKKCINEYAKQWRKLKQEAGREVTESGKIKQFPTEDRLLVSAIRNRVHGARQNTKRNPERDFDITAEYMYEIYQQQKGLCYLSGRPLSLVKNTPNTLSIDKIYPEQGYTKGNVRWVCWAANRARGDLTDKEFLCLCKEILEKGVETIENLSERNGIELVE